VDVATSIHTDKLCVHIIKHPELSHRFSWCLEFLPVAQTSLLTPVGQVVCMGSDFLVVHGDLRFIEDLPSSWREVESPRTKLLCFRRALLWRCQWSPCVRLVFASVARNISSAWGTSSLGTFARSFTAGSHRDGNLWMGTFLLFLESVENEHKHPTITAAFPLPSSNGSTCFGPNHYLRPHSLA